MAMNQEIIVRLLLRERTKILAYIWSIVRDEDLADDIYQDISVLVLKKMDQIKDEDHLQKWLRTTARYKAFNVLQKRKHAPLALDAVMMEQLEAEWEEYDDVHSNEVVSALRKCLAELSPYARQLVHLRYAEGLSGQVLAKALNRKLHTVYMAVSRVHRVLAKCIHKRIGGEEVRNG